MPARLHHERIAGASAERWLLLTHGIYGAGTNLKTIARKLTEQRPEWGVVLVDLRLHGRSEPGLPPHTVDACADDVCELANELGSIAALAGHSFGGKVVLAARERAQVRQTWVLDATPGARPTAMAERGNTVVQILELLERLPQRWPRRDAFIAAITGAGHDPGLAGWLATNLVPDTTGELRVRLDPAALRPLLVDYYARDLWASLLEPGWGSVEIIIGSRSSAVSAADRDRLRQAPPHVRVHVIDAGHWLHVDDPGAVVELFATYLPGPVVPTSAA
ncbi:MAG: alpha/beta fold hydrolase [Kofleriaceae bacterium]